MYGEIEFRDSGTGNLAYALDFPSIRGYSEMVTGNSANIKKIVIRGDYHNHYYIYSLAILLEIDASCTGAIIADTFPTDKRLTISRVPDSLALEIPLGYSTRTAQNCFNNAHPPTI